MDALMLVEVLDVHGHVQIRHRVSGAGGRCRIGRSLACDITVDDAHVAAEHAQLTLQPDGLVLVEDLGTRNGTRLDGRPVPGAGSLIAGGEMLIGRTRVRLRTQDGPLPPERPIHRDLLRRHQSALAAVGLVLCIGFATFQQWLRSPTQLAQLVLVSVLAAVAGLAVWVATWSLVSRLTVGAWQVRIHMAIATFCVALWAWGHWLYGIGAFALQWRLLGPVMAGLAGIVALGAAYLHLRNATHIHRMPSLLLAMLAPLLCGGVWWLVDLQLDPRTVDRVQSGPAIQPPALRLAPSVDLSDYLADVASLKREASTKRQQSLLQAPVVDLED